MSVDKDEMLKFGCSIEHYIKDNFSICREERQYAVFLYNILRKYRKPEKRNDVKDINNIFTACGLQDATVESVFYEATFMRDFFERNRRLVLGKNEKVEDVEKILLRRSFLPSCKEVNAKDEEESFNKSFNKRLIQYIAKSGIIKKQEPICLGSCEEVNLGHNTIVPGEVGTVARYMMNVKPDIAVIYKQNGQKNLLFIECKFDSDESAYRCGFKQRVIQWHVAKFLCDNYLKEEGIALSDQMKNGQSHLVRFVRKEVEIPRNEIEINRLIELNDDIFGDEKDG